MSEHIHITANHTVGSPAVPVIPTRQQQRQTSNGGIEVTYNHSFEIISGLSRIVLSRSRMEKLAHDIMITRLVSITMNSHAIATNVQRYSLTLESCNGIAILSTLVRLSSQRRSAGRQRAMLQKTSSSRLRSRRQLKGGQEVSTRKKNQFKYIYYGQTFSKESDRYYHIFPPTFVVNHVRCSGIC